MADVHPGFDPQPLPRGRHKLPREEVRASQRLRLLLAMEELVNEHGYAATSVPKVVARARVTNRTFYEQFEDKADCFIALCETYGAGLLETISADIPELEATDDPLASFDDGLARYLDWWMERPAAARAFFVELPSAGARAHASRDRRQVLFAAALQQLGTALRARVGDGEPVPEIHARAAAAIGVELVAREIRAGRIAELSALHADLRRVLLTLLLGRDPGEGS